MMEDFELGVSMERFLTISKRLHSARIPYFSTTVTRSQLEIPAEFVREHGGEFNIQSTLRLASSSKEWPVKIQVTWSTRWRVRFSTSRWRGFQAETGLRKGDELIVSLVARSEFAVYMFKKHLKDPPNLYRFPSLTPDTSSQSSDSSDDDLPENDAPTAPQSRKSPPELRARQPLNISTPQDPAPALKEMHWAAISPDNILARRLVARDQPESSRHGSKRQKVAASSPRREPVREILSEIVSEDIFNAASRFRKKLTDACIGNARQTRFEIPADFLRDNQRFFSEGTEFTLEGPTLGKTCQVVCHRARGTSHRVMWTKGWQSFVKRNKLKIDDELEFTLVTPNRCTVERTNDHTTPLTDAILSLKRSGSPARRGKTSNELPPDSVHRTHPSEVADQNEKLHFIKTLPPSSDVECNPYPFLSVPAPFWHKVMLPLEVNLQGPNSDEVFAVKCSGGGKKIPTKSFALGWKEYSYSNMLQAGDTLQFTYAIETKLFTVDYANVD